MLNVSKILNALWALWALLTLRLAVSLVVLMVVLFVALPVVAQGVTETPPPSPLPVNGEGEVPEQPPDVALPIGDAGVIVATAIFALVSAALKWPITTLAVSWLKRLSFLSNVSSGVLALAVAALLTAGMWIAREAGYETQYTSLLGLITVVGAALGDFVVTLFGSSALYNAAVAVKVPGLKYQRPGGGTSAAGAGRY